MKRFIAALLLLTLLCSVASADVLVRSLSTAYCAAFSLDGQHCLMMEPLPEDASHYRLYIRHADGSITDIVPTGLTEQDPPYAAEVFDRCTLPASGIRVCGNSVILNTYTPSHHQFQWLVNLLSGEALLLHRTAGYVSGQRAALVSNGSVRILDGESGILTEQPLPEGVHVAGACALENGVLLSARTDGEYVLLWLDAQGNETHRLACTFSYEHLYYDEKTNTGMAARSSMTKWSWFNPYMIMQMQLPELPEQPATTEEMIDLVTSTPFYISLTPETAKTGNSHIFNSFYPLGMTENGQFLLNWNKLGWLCTLNVATLQLTPLITANDKSPEILELGPDLYSSVWNGSTLFCNPDKLQPLQYVEIDHPALH